MERPTQSHVPFSGRHGSEYIIYQSYSPTTNFNQRYQLMHQKFAKEHSQKKKKKKNHSLLTSLTQNFINKELKNEPQKQRKEKQKPHKRISKEIFGSLLRDIKIFQKQPSFDLDTYKYE